MEVAPKIKSSNKEIFLFVSLEWQCYVYSKIILSSKIQYSRINIILLRKELDKHVAWSNIKNQNLIFIDLSKNFNLSNLSLLKSFYLSHDVRNSLKESLMLNKKNKFILLTDNLYRIYELCLLSLLPDIDKIIYIPHGLTSPKSSFSKIKFFLSCKLRLLLFFYFQKILNQKKITFINNRLVIAGIKENSKKKNHIICGNMQVKLTVEKLLMVKPNQFPSNNFLFMTSGSFRYPDNIFDNKKTIEAINFARRHCINNNKKLFIKTKQGENIENIEDIENILILDSNENYVDLIDELKPEYIFCSHHSTAVSELLLSGFKVILYDAGNFKGINTYTSIYAECNFKSQDLHLDELAPIKFSNEKDKNNFINLIGLSNVNFNLLDTSIQKS